MKKTFKKLTAVLLAVCLTLSVLSLTAVSAAETDSAAAGMDPILLEYTGTYTYDLTATADGLMCVSCYGDDEIYITDTEDNWINGYDDNLFVIFAVKAGQSYVIHLRSFDEEPELEVLNGKYGPYIAYKGVNYKLPKSMHERARELTLEECMSFIQAQQEKEADTEGSAPRKRRYFKRQS